MRQWVMPVVLCAVAGSCRKSPPPPPAPTPAPEAEAPAAAPAEAPAWRARSADGEWTLEQFIDAAGACRATASSKQGPGWTAATCLATANQLPFLSADGQTLIVLEPTPRFAGDGAWASADVVRRFVKGALVEQVPASALVADGEKLTRYTRYFGWAKGAGGVLGDAPRLSPDGAAVLLETADGRTARLGFDGQRTVSPVPVAAAAEPPAADPAAPRPGCRPGQLCQYVDEQGTTQFTDGASVPARFRAKARPVDAQLGVMETPPAAPAKVPPGAQAMNDPSPAEEPSNGITVTLPPEDGTTRRSFHDNVMWQSQAALMAGKMDRLPVVAGKQYPGCTPDPVDPRYVYCPKFLHQGQKPPAPAAKPVEPPKPPPPPPQKPKPGPTTSVGVPRFP